MISDQERRVPAREHCVVCCEQLDPGRTVWPSGRQMAWCEACETKYPVFLLMAVADGLHCSLQLRTGVVIRFSSALIRGEFVYLSTGHIQGPKSQAFPRGIDVRVADIVYCAFAPEGS